MSIHKKTLAIWQVWRPYRNPGAKQPDRHDPRSTCQPPHERPKTVKTNRQYRPEFRKNHIDRAPCRDDSPVQNHQFAPNRQLAPNRPPPRMDRKTWHGATSKGVTRATDDATFRRTQGALGCKERKRPTVRPGERHSVAASSERVGGGWREARSNTRAPTPADGQVARNNGYVRRSSLA